MDIVRRPLESELRAGKKRQNRPDRWAVLWQAARGRTTRYHWNARLASAAWRPALVDFACKCASLGQRVAEEVARPNKAIAVEWNFHGHGNLGRVLFDRARIHA